MKAILLYSIVLIFTLNSTFSFASAESQFETLEDYLSAPITSIPSEAQMLESNLIENLLSGVDFAITNAVIAGANRNSSDSSYYISLQLVLLSATGELVKIELFKSDEFSGKSGFVELNKEFYIQGADIFKTLDPYVEYIETAQKLNLAVSLVKSESLVEKPIRNLGQNDFALNSPHIIFTFNLDPSLNTQGFKQDLNLPEAFSHADNSDITDIGFSLYYR